MRKEAITSAALEEFELVSEVKAEVAQVTYDAQDAKTQKLIDKVAETITTYLTGQVTFDGATFWLSDECVKQNARSLAVEVVKDLARLDIQVGSFEFPTNQCATCGADL